MTQTTNTQTATQRKVISKVQVHAPIIAVRKSCNPSGIGLSHYVLMDKKSAK